MKIIKSDLDSAVQEEILSVDQAKKLWIYLQSMRTYTGQFHGLYALYCFAGLLILISMTWFLVKVESYRGAFMVLSGFFALFFVFLGNKLWKKNMKIPGGLLITAAVGLTPLFIYGFQTTVGFSFQDFFDDYSGKRVFMELGTIFTALIALRFYCFPLITFPLVFSLWIMSMDLTSLLLGEGNFNENERIIVMGIFGLIVLIASYFIDKKFQKVDFAKWTYLYGMLSLWCGLSFIDHYSELSRFFLLLLNIGFIFIGVYLRRKIFLIFGAFGVLTHLKYYLAGLSWFLFKDYSYAPPLILG